MSEYGSPEIPVFPGPYDTLIRIWLMKTRTSGKYAHEQYTPLNLNFSKTRVYNGIPIFLSFAPKQGGGSNMYQQSMFRVTLQNIKKKKKKKNI